MRGTATKTSIAYKRDVVAAVLPEYANGGPSTVADLAVSYAAGDFTATWTTDPNAGVGDERLYVRLQGAAWTAAADPATSPETVAELGVGKHDFVLISEYADGRRYYSNLASASNVVVATAQVQTAPCNRQPGSSATKGDLLSWLDEVGVVIGDASTLTKGELRTLIVDYCDEP